MVIIQLNLLFDLVHLVVCQARFQMNMCEQSYSLTLRQCNVASAHIIRFNLFQILMELELRLINCIN